MLAVHPVSAQMAWENRQFLGRAVSYVAARGVRQFIDVGAGLPTALNTHDIARHIDPEARVAYVDNDRHKWDCGHARKTTVRIALARWKSVRITLARHPDRLAMHTANRAARGYP